MDARDTCRHMQVLVVSSNGPDRREMKDRWAGRPSQGVLHWVAYWGITFPVQPDALPGRK